MRSFLAMCRVALYRRASKNPALSHTGKLTLEISEFSPQEGGIVPVAC